VSFNFNFNLFSTLLITSATTQTSLLTSKRQSGPGSADALMAARVPVDALAIGGTRSYSTLLIIKSCLHALERWWLSKHAPSSPSTKCLLLMSVIPSAAAIRTYARTSSWKRRTDAGINF
jgi:hypothetical protein